jgi:hypothetical protein
MTQMDLFQTATYSPQDTHASHSVLPGSAEAQKMTDISGHTYFPLLKESDPLGAFSRMFMGMSLWASTRCYLTWKGKATPQGRSLFQLVPQTHPTDETEFGSSLEMWATPRTSDTTAGRTLNEKGQRISKSSDLVFGANLADQVKMWPTPRARDWKMTGDVANWKESNIGDTYLRRAVAETDETPGSLNPQWVEWLMGYPEGWTDLED